MRIAVIFFSLLIIVFSCKDSKDEVMDPGLIIEAPDDKMEIEEILAGTSSRAWVSESFNLEIYGSIECRSDDVFTFFNDGTFEYDGGQMLCGDSDNSQIVTGTWEVDLNNNRIIFDKGLETETIANYITVKEDVLRVMGSWNSLSIDASYIRQ
ncbi:MAG: hypothetical protein RH860_16100 [Cytophagales bacterium]